MRILICSSDPASKAFASFAARSFRADLPLEFLADSSFTRSFRKKAADALVYFDAALGLERVLELASRLREVECRGWAVIDRKGESADPAAFFFAGSCDYIGPALFKAGLGPDRVETALEYAGMSQDPQLEPERAVAAAAAFPGWAGLEENSEVFVRFCYAAIGNQKSLLERIGEKRLDKLREDFAAFLESWSKECGGLVWIRETAGCLLLFPPQDEGMNPVLAAFRLLLDRALVGYEVFRLEVPLSFRFAFHAGRTPWRKPGATGKIVSEDVNFVFHLGMKAAGDGFIVLSGEAESAVPAGIRDLFSPAGDYEGKSLIASRRFKD